VRVGFLVLAAAVVAVGVGYFFLVRNQQDAKTISARAIFFLGFLGMQALLLAATPLAAGRWPVRLAIAAISGLVCAGGLAILSLGVVFVLIAAGTLALLIGLIPGEPDRRPGPDRLGRVLAGTLPVLILIIGLSLT
jgi:hypothetical protein